MGLISLLYELLESSRRNAHLCERLIYTLEAEHAPNQELSDNFEQSAPMQYRSDNLSEYNDSDECPSEYVCQHDKVQEDSHAALYRSEFDLDSLMSRRIQLHKDQGTYAEPDNEISTLLEELNQDTMPLFEAKDHERDPPKINPLHRLRADELERLSFQLFKEAQHNTKNLMSIPETSEDYQAAVEKEADRLLNQWMHANKF